MKSALIFVFLVLLGFLLLDYYGSAEYCSYTCIANFDGIVSNSFILTIFFSAVFVLTKFWSETVWKYWWSFAKYAIPVVFVLSVLINSGIHHNPNGQWQDILDIPILLTLYGLFIVGSLVQIWRGYLEIKVK